MKQASNNPAHPHPPPIPHPPPHILNPQLKKNLGYASATELVLYNIIFNRLNISNLMIWIFFALKSYLQLAEYMKSDELKFFSP